jgi:Bacterial toxin 35
MKEGVEGVYTKTNGGNNPALKRTLQIAGETVEVTFIRLANGQIKISNAWVKTR